MRLECVRRIGARLIWEVAGLLAFYIFTSHVAVDFFHDMRPVGARAQISAFLAALQNYRSDVGEFPSQAQGLRALRIDPGVRRWNEPYLRPDVPTIRGANRFNIVSPPDACEYFRWVAAALKASVSFQANLSSNPPYIVH